MKLMNEGLSDVTEIYRVNGHDQNFYELYKSCVLLYTEHKNNTK